MAAGPAATRRAARYDVRAANPASGIMTPVTEPFRWQTAEGYQWIMHPPVDPYGEGYVRKADVEIRADGLTVRTTATLSAMYDKVDLAEYFAGLAADWRGWKGERQWEALEQEMQIDSWHDGRANVMVAVTVRRPERAYADDAWSARIVFTLESGEQLTALASDIRNLLAA